MIIINEKKFYLTKNRLAQAQKEYRELKEIRNLKIKQELSSEPSCFLEDIDFLEARIAELEKILNNVELIKKPPLKEQCNINLGATVLLWGEDGRTNKFTIVGTIEANPNEGKISFCSPLGRALLGHKIGDQIVFVSSRTVIYKVLKINYQIK